jgi:hypothetical protein
VSRGFLILIILIALGWVNATAAPAIVLYLGGVSPVYYSDLTSISALPTAYSYSGWTTGTGSCVNSSGALVVSGIAGPCLDHSQLTGAPLGLRYEGSRTNLVLESNAFNLTWTQSNASITANSATSPDGANDAWLLAENTTATVTHQTSQVFVALVGTTYSFTAYVKQQNRSATQFQYYDGVKNAFPNFNLANCSVIAANNGLSVSASAVINGFCKLSFSAVASTTAAAVYLYPVLSGTAQYAGTVGSGIYVYGAQVEVGSFSSSYIQTSTTSVTRAADSLSLAGAAATAAAKGPTILETQNEQTGVISRACYAAGAFAFPAYNWIRKLAIFQPSQTCNSLTRLLNVSDPL